MDGTAKVGILHHCGPGFIPQEPLALVAKFSASERKARGFGSNVDQCTTSPDTLYRMSIRLL